MICPYDSFVASSDRRTFACEVKDMGTRIVLESGLELLFENGSYRGGGWEMRLNSPVDLTMIFDGLALHYSVIKAT